MDKNNKINEINNRINQLEIEKAELIQTLTQLENEETHTDQILGVPSRSQKIILPEEKISLFLELFSGRTDVFARYWTNSRKGTSGYSPACSNEWVKSQCDKPRIKCIECSNQSFIPLDESVIRNHLEGKLIIGVYPILPDDTCRFLAVDFDESDWLKDIISYKNSAIEIGVEVAIERSKSGNGGHAWIFFTEPVSAKNARQLGTIILSKAISKSPAMKMESFDRFFPNQDFLPKGGLGNLIALPLQKNARAINNTEFIDDAGLSFEDQWTFLSAIHKIRNNELITLLRKHGALLDQTSEIETEIQVAQNIINSSTTTSKYDLKDNVLRVELSSVLRIATDSIPVKVAAALKRTSVFANPKFFELQRLRFSTWKTPRYICCGEIDGNVLVLPRGCLDKIKDIVVNAGGNLSLLDESIENPTAKITFLGKLLDIQNSAVSEMAKHETGVLVAPPGSGKTVIACNLIAFRGQRTLILTHRKQLVDQWKSQLKAFLDTGKEKDLIDVQMIQTLARRGVETINPGKYGFVIVDECHHIPAISFESVLKGLKAKYILGLTATPFRKDGLQPIIYMQCGPVRFEMKETISQSIDKIVVVKETKFRFLGIEAHQEPIHEVWERMVNDADRNDQITDDVVKVLNEKGFPLILSDRKDQIGKLYESLKIKTFEMNAKGFCLIGGMGKKARKNILDEIKSCLNSSNPVFLIATGSFIGEGFDLPELDTLFLTMPIAFKGRIIQYTGRLHRDSPEKTEISVYDYFDTHLPLTISMFKKRLSAYRKMGYSINLNGISDAERWQKKRKAIAGSPDLFY